MATDINILKNMHAVHLNVTLWTARTKLRKEDFGPNASNLPDEELASLGSKKIAPQEKLRIFSTKKAAAVSLLDRFGVRFLGGWLVPDSTLPLVEAGLNDIHDEFNAAKADFLDNYTTILSEWLDAHPEWYNILEGSFASPDYVQKQLQFGWHSYRLALHQNKDFTDEVAQVGNTLIDSVVADAESMWKNTFVGRNEIGQKTLRPLKALATKLEGLTLIDPLVEPIMNLITNTLSRMPPSGTITGFDLAMIQGLVCLLRDKDTLLSHANRVLDGDDTEAILDALLDSSSQPLVEDEEEPEIVLQAQEPTDIALPKESIQSWGLW